MAIDIPRDELGRSIGGGIPENSLIIMEGQEGAGKSAIAQRIMFGLLENGYTGTYIRTYVYWKAGNRLALGGPGKSYECTPHGYGVMNYLIKDEKMNNPEIHSI